jgi:rifampicin phosphotransferase
LQGLFHRTETQALQAELEASQTGQAFLEQFHFFLEQYGHRETTLTISQPAWKDQPEVVLEILKVLAETERKQTKHAAEWQTTRDQLLTNSILGSPVLRTLFLKSLTNARAFFQIREDTHFYATLMQPTIRRVSLELGRRLVQAGTLREAEEVFHLRLEELESVGKQWPLSKGIVEETRALVARRQALRERLANKPMIDPRLLTVTHLARDEDNVLLSGTSGSPGLARGPAKIVRDISEFGKLRAGDVLVAPVTNPAWTPLFQRAAAVVVDTGGTASHAAIVAREYGVPAVMGTMNGTSVLKDGQWIQVDGSRGLVLKTEEPK